MATISYVTETFGVKITNVIYFDATMKENHEASAEITKHDIEKGAALTDHVRPSRIGVTLEVMVTNTPIQSVGRLEGMLVPTVLGTSQRVISDGGGFRPARDPQVSPNFVQPGPKLPGVPRYTSPARVVPGDRGNMPVQFVAKLFTFPNPRDRLVDLWTAFNELRMNATELKVATRLHEYESMLIARVTAPVEAADAINFTLVFEQVGYSDSLVFEQVTKVERPAVKKAKPEEEQGPKDPYIVGSNTAKSVLIRGIEFITGYKAPPTQSSPGL